MQRRVFLKIVKKVVYHGSPPKDCQLYHGYTELRYPQFWREVKTKYMNISGSPILDSFFAFVCKRMYLLSHRKEVSKTKNERNKDIRFKEYWHSAIK